MKQLLALIFAVAAFGHAGTAVGRECTRDEAYAAETVTDYLTSWENVYMFYKQFGHCYEGSIAEGTEDKVQLLWANHWATLPQMISLMKKDAGFKALMLRIAQSEAFPLESFKKVLKSANLNCPQGAADFCQAIKAAAGQAHAA
jgi:hypothetical protein